MTEQPQIRMLVFAAILPHTRLFGGVKRFLEVGNILISKGHSFIIFAEEVTPVTWFDFKGNVELLDRLSDYELDMMFVSEKQFLPLLKKSNATVKIFYALIERSFVKAIARKQDLTVIANSLSLYKYLNGKRRSNVIHAPGGVDLDQFKFNPKPADDDGPFIVMAYGRFYRKKKGTNLVIRACEKLYASGYNIKLILFDSPTDAHAIEQIKKFKCSVPHEFFIDHPRELLQDIYYKADVFVSAERNAGWSNTTAEAMACGVPVIATNSGTEDFLVHNETGLRVWRHPFFIQRALKKMYSDRSIGKELSRNARRKIEEFSWQNLAEKILSIYKMVSSK